MSNFKPKTWSPSDAHPQCSVRSVSKCKPENSIVTHDVLGSVCTACFIEIEAAVNARFALPATETSKTDWTSIATFNSRGGAVEDVELAKKRARSNYWNKNKSKRGNYEQN